MRRALIGGGTCGGHGNKRPPFVVVSESVNLLHP